MTEALDQVRPYLGSHAGGVELLGVDAAGVVHLRLEGSCDGCPSSVQTVKLAIERAIEEAAPEVAGVEVENLTREREPQLLQIKPLYTECAVPAAAIGPSGASDPEGSGRRGPGHPEGVPRWIGQLFQGVPR